jgi:hypothetical protein
MLSHRRSPLALSAKSGACDVTAQVWSLAFDGKRSAPAATPLAAQQLAGCAISFLDLIETPEDEESLRWALRRRQGPPAASR